MKRSDILVYKDVKKQVPLETPHWWSQGESRQNKSLSWTRTRRLTVLADVYADGVDVGEVGGLHGGAGGPHVVEEEDWHGGEAKHAQPGHAQNVRQEHKLETHTHRHRQEIHAQPSPILRWGSHHVWTYHSADAASTDGGLELAVKLLDGAGRVEALSQQDDPVQEEEGGDAVDDVLHQLDSVRGRRWVRSGESQASADNKRYLQAPITWRDPEIACGDPRKTRWWHGKQITECPTFFFFYFCRWVFFYIFVEPATFEWSLKCGDHSWSTSLGIICQEELCLWRHLELNSALRIYGNIKHVCHHSFIVWANGSPIETKSILGLFSSLKPTHKGLINLKIACVKSSLIYPPSVFMTVFTVMVTKAQVSKNT